MDEFETIYIQGEELILVPDSDGDDGNDNLIRTQTENQEKDGLNGLGQDVPGGNTANPGLPEYDDYGLRPGYTGVGYLDINGTDTGSQAEITFEAPAGTYEITLRLGSGSGDPRPMTIDIDGETATIDDTRTGDWFVWETRTITIEITGDGEHTLTILQDGTNGAPNIDAIAIAAAGEPVTFEAPEFASPTSFDIDENETAVGQVQAGTVDGPAISYTLDGDDAALFDIDADGNITFIEAPDFEAMGSAAGTNTYTVDVIASNGFAETTQTVNISVLDVDDGETPEPMPLPITIQAEDGDITGSTTQVRDAENPEPSGLRPDFTGTGYVDYGSADNDAVTFTVVVAAAGDYDLNIRYATNGLRPLDLSVNGGAEQSLQFTDTDPDGGGSLEGFDNWEFLTQTITLQEGVNTISLLIPDEQGSGPNLDRIEITEAGTGPIDLSADEDGNLAVAPVVDAFLSTDDLSTVEFRLSGVDDDIETIEVSTDGGATFAPAVTVVDGADIVASVDLSAFDSDAAVQFRLTDGSDNEEIREVSVAIVTVPEGAIVIQAEDETQVDVTDVPGTGTGNEIREVNPDNPDPFGNYRAGGVGEAYIDYGSTPGDSMTFNVDAPVTGTYQVTFRYVNGGNADRPLELLVGGELIQTLPFPPTPAAGGGEPWEDWTDYTVAIDLEAGANTVSLTIPEGFTSGPNIDMAIFLPPEDATADEGGDLAVSTASEFEPDELGAVDFTFTGLDDDIETVEVSTDGGATFAPVSIVGDVVTLDLSAFADADAVDVQFRVTDDASNTATTATSLTIVEDPVTPITFGDMSAYAGSQNRPGDGGAGVVLADEGATVTLSGNLWQRVNFPEDYTITDNTTLSFDLEVGTVVSEIIAVGFDNDEDPFNGNGTIYQVAGTQPHGSFINVAGTPAVQDIGGGVLRVTLDLSDLAGQTMSSLVLVADDDFLNNGIGAPTFSNMAFIEGEPEGNTAPRIVGNGIADGDFFTGDSVEIDLAFIDDEGDDLEFTLTVLDGGSNDVTAQSGLSIVDGVIVGTLPDELPGGDYTISVEASDGEFTTTDTFVIGVEEVNQAPEVVSTAFEPILGKVGEPIASIDLSLFSDAFSDPEGQDLTLSVEGLPAGLSLNGEGVIAGTPQEVGAGFFTIIATDPGGLTAELQIQLTIDSPAIGEVVSVEAEDFTGLDDAQNFFDTATAGASNNQIIRTNAFDTGSIDTLLSANGLVEGWYTVQMDVYDETDGGATFTLQIGDTVLADGASFDDDGEYLNPTGSRGNAGQSGNLKRLSFETAVFIDATTIAQIIGQADDELLRIDRLLFTRVEEPSGDAPTAPVLDTSAVDENSDGAIIGTLSSSDADGDDNAIVFSVDPTSDYEIVNGQLKLKPGVSLDHEASETDTVAVTATDSDNNETTATLTITVNDVNEAPELAVATLDDVTLTVGEGETVDLTILAASDVDDGDTPVYGVRSATETPLPAGFIIDGTSLVVPDDLAAGTYEVEIFATDGELESESVQFSVTVEEPVPFTPIVVQEDEGVLTVLDADANTNDTQIRNAANPEDNPNLVNGLRPDFSGTGYLDFGDTPGDVITFTFTVEEAGSYDLNVRYASNTGRPLDLSVNGGTAQSLPFASTDPDGTGPQEGFDNWLFETVTIDLVAGENTVSLAIPEGTNTGPNVDRIEITEAGTGPIPPADETADEGGDLAITPEVETVEVDDLATVAFRLVGVDDDIEIFEVSLDGGVTFTEISVTPDGEDFIATLDLSSFVEEDTADILFRLTDDAENEVEQTASIDITEEIVVSPITIQAEDDSLVTVDDVGEGGQGEVTREVNPSNPDDFGNYRPGGVGDAYMDFGTNPGDEITFAVDVPVAGTYTVTFRYTNGDADEADRPLNLVVNGGTPVLASFPFTDGVEPWEAWSEISYEIELEAGVNSVALSIPATGDNGPNIDQAVFEYTDNSVDDTADEGGDLAASAAAVVDPDDLDAVSFTLAGVDADIVTFEYSTDGGTTFTEVSPIGDVITLDLSAFAADSSAEVIFRVTDDAENQATTSATIAIEEQAEPFSLEIQAETFTIIDTTPGTDDTELTQVRDSSNPEEPNADRGPDGLWDDFTGTGYMDMGLNTGDAVSFEVDAPAAGTYTLTFRYANGSNAARPMEVTVGTQSVEIPFGPTTDWDQWVEVSIDVELEEGVNTVNVANTIDTGPNLDRVIVSNNIEPETEVEPGPRETIQINFQDGTVPAVAGWLVANFTGFADQGNGYTYGFVTEASATDADGTVNTPIDGSRYPAIAINERSGEGDDSSLDAGRDFDSYNPLLTGYAHFDLGSYPGAQDDPNERVAFELAVENGWYEVTVAVGDTGGPNDSNNQLEIEGQLVSSYIPTNFYKTELVTTVVKVEDGHLTLAAPNGTITEMQYLEVRNLPDLTPEDSNEAPVDYAAFTNPTAIAGVGADQEIVDLDPASGPVLDIDPTSDITIGVAVAPERGGVLLESLNDGSIRVFETLTGEEVDFDVNTTGGFDSLTISPVGTLKEFTSYTIVIDGFQDRGSNLDLDAPTREFQKFSTTFTTKAAPEVEAREVAFVETLEAVDAVMTSVEMSADGQYLYASTLGGQIKRWTVDPVDGSLSNQVTLELSDSGYFFDEGVGPRGIIGLVVDPTDPNVIWVTDNYPVPLNGRDNGVPDFSGRITKITLDEGEDFSGTPEAYITGLPRSNGDHVTNSLEFRLNPDFGDPGEPEYLLYVIQGSNSAMGEADSAWGNRPERLLNAAVMEIDPTRDAPDGGFDVQTEPLPTDGQNRRFIDDDDDIKDDPIPMGNGEFLVFAENGTATVQDAGGNVLETYYDPFAEDAVLTIFATGQRNAYDLVWHSNGYLYTPTNGSASGGNVPDNPDTPQDESQNGVERQDDYLFVISEGTYSGHPNPLRDEYILNGGNPTGGQDTNQVNAYPVGTDPESNYDVDRAYTLGPNRSPNGAIEYKSDVFGSSLQGAIMFTEYSSGNDLRAIIVDPVTGIPTGIDFVIRDPEGNVISHPDPLDVIEGADGRLYLLTLNRSNGESLLIRLDPAPGGEVADNTADAGGDLELVVLDSTDAGNVLFEVRGLDSDIQTILISLDGGPAQAITLDGQNRFTADLSGEDGDVTVELTVEDDDDNTASTSVDVAPGEAGTTQFLDATVFTILSSLTGDDATVIRLISDPSTHEPGDSNDANGDGMNDGYDGVAYLDPNGGAEDKASFTFFATEAGTHTFTFRMANGDGTGNPRPIAIKAGSQSETISDTQTGSFTNWQDFTITLDLVAGDNTIVIEQTTNAGAPNIDSIVVTSPGGAADTTADVGNDLALSVVDASDGSAVIFEVSGLDADIETLEISLDGGTTSQTVTLDGQNRFTLDTGVDIGEVTAELTVTDDASNTATASITFDAGITVPNDGTETVGGIDYFIYEAENADLDGGPNIISDTTDERGQSGGEFIDFDGTADQSITWTVAVSEAGTYSVDFIYALATSKAARPAELTVNGVDIGTLPFAPNSNEAENIWGPQTAELVLEAGVNTIEITVPNANGANIDYLRVSQEPVDTFEPVYADIDGEGRIELEATDGTTRTVNDTTAEFYFTVDEDGAFAFDLAANPGAPDGQGLTLFLSADDGLPVEIDDNGFPGEGDDGETTAYANLLAGVQYKLTVVSDAPGANALDYLDVRPAPGDEDADIEIQSQDPSYFDDRLHFSWIDNPTAVVSDTPRDYKENAFVEISNSGTATLEFLEADITGPFELADPDVFEGLTLEAGESIEVEVIFDRDAYTSGPSSVSGVFEGAINLRTNDADSPLSTIDLAGFWQARDEGGQEPNINEVWEVFGFGNFIEGLTLVGGGESDELDFYDIYLPVDETEVLSPYFKLADGVGEARITQIAAFHSPSGATLGIHAPGNKNADVIFTNHANTGNQTLLPLLNNGNFATATFDGSDIPNAWEGDDIFGIEVANLSTDPTLNPTGSGTPSQAELNARYPGYTVDGSGQVFDPEGNPVSDGYTVRIFQAVDEDGVIIENVYLGVMDYTGINYDYNDNMFIIEGVVAVGNGAVLAVDGLDEAAADDRLVFTNIENPANGSQVFRNEATFTITNDGLGTLTINDIVIGDGSAFQIVGTVPDSLAAGESADITVEFIGADGVDNNAAVLYESEMTIFTSAGEQIVNLAGLAQLQSESGEEPSVAQIVQAFGYGTDMAQGQLANNGQVELVGDEVFLPYLQRLDGSQPVEIYQIAAFLQQGDVARLSLHDVDNAGLAELFAADDNQGQTVLPDGLVSGTGNTGVVASGTISRDEPFGLHVGVDGRPTYAAWTDPDANDLDPDFGQLVNGDAGQGHLIRFFEAKDGDGNVIEGTYIGIMDYPGAGNYDYNDFMFVIKNVEAYELAGDNDGNGNDVNDALETDSDNDGLADFFDETDDPQTDEQAPFPGPNAPGFTDGLLTVQAINYDVGGQGVSYNDSPGLDNGVGRGSDAVEFVGSDIGHIEDGEWTEYTIDVPASGTYLLSVNAKTPIGGNTITASIEGGPALATFVLPDANGAGDNGFGGTDFDETDQIAIQLEEGTQTLRFTFEGDPASNGYVMDFRSFSLEQVDEPEGQSPFPGPDAAAFVDGVLTLDASNYDEGGQGVAYNDAPGLQGGNNGGRAGSDVEQTSTGHIGWIGEGEWLEYTIEVPEDGEYDLDLFLATPDGGRSATVSFYREGEDTPYATSGPIANTPSGSYTNFQPRGVDGISLEEGTTVLRVTFSGGSQDFQSFSLSQVEIDENEAPTTSGIADTVADEGEAFNLDVSGEFDDADNDTLTFTASGLPAGLSISAAGVISGTPTVDGEFEVTVTADDGEEEVSTSFTLQITAANEAPTTSGIADASADENDPFSLDVSGAFEDDDGDALTFTASGLPAGLSISPAGVISGTPTIDGEFEVTVTADDGEDEVSTSFTLTVDPEVIVEPVQSPFPGPNAPGFVDGLLTVDATNFDNGGQGVAYNDNPGKDGGNSLRPDTDVEFVGGQNDLGYVLAGEWVEYTIEVPQSGTYLLTLNAKTPVGGNSIALSLGDGPALTTVALPDANGAGNNGFGGTAFSETQAVEVELPAGTQTLRFTFDGAPATNGYILDFRAFTLELVENAAPTTSGIADAAADEGEAFSLDVSGAFEDDDGDTLTFTASGLPTGLSISAAGLISGTPSVDGEFEVTVTADDGEDEVSTSFTLTVDPEVVEPSGQTPFPGPSAPGFVDNVLTVDASNYDEGGQGVAYNDAAGLQGGNTGGRAGSDVEQTSSGDVGWISSGEWLEYTINVDDSGSYDFSALMANGGGGGRSLTVSFYKPGEDTPYATSGSIANPSTGSWSNFVARTAEDIDLDAGEQIVRITFNGGSQDIRSFTLTGEPDDGQAPFPGPDLPEFVDGLLTIDASNYDEGGQGVAYNDAAGLQGGNNGGRAGSDVEQTPSGDIGWVANGDWLEYSFNVGEAGTYDLSLLMATVFGGRSATVSFYQEGEDEPYLTTGPIANPSTGTWGNFQPRTAQGLQLEEGETIMRITLNGPGGGEQDLRSFTLELAEEASFTNQMAFMEFMEFGNQQSGFSSDQIDEPIGLAGARFRPVEFMERVEEGSLFGLQSSSVYRSVNNMDDGYKLSLVTLAQQYREIMDSGYTVQGDLYEAVLENTPGTETPAQETVKANQTASIEKVNLVSAPLEETDNNDFDFAEFYIENPDLNDLA